MLSFNTFSVYNDMSTAMEAGCVVDFGPYGLSVKDGTSVDIGIVTDCYTNCRQY